MLVLTYHEVADGDYCTGCKYLMSNPYVDKGQSFDEYCSLFENINYPLSTDPVSYQPLKCEACRVATSATFDYHVDVPVTIINAG